MRRWHLRSAGVNELVTAADQHAAWNTLRTRPVEDFGIIVTAEADESGDPFPIRTSTLMFMWGREEDARLALNAAAARGLPDTEAADRRLAGLE